MGTLFATDEWVKALMVELNQSEDYAKAARKWEGDFYFIVESDDGDAFLYMDLWHGECRDAFKADSEDAKSPEFQLRAPVATWQAVINKKMDPIQGIVTRKLKLQGPMMKVMKAPKAAIELVEACGRLDTDWPS